MEKGGGADSSRSGKTPNTPAAAASNGFSAAMIGAAAAVTGGCWTNGNNLKPSPPPAPPMNESEPLFFDTQMVSCVWGEEEGVLLIFNDVSLRIVNEKLREIERFKDKMLSTVTHDLKTPLNSIIMILENSIE